MKIFDAHFHIVDNQFPLTPNNGYLPDEFTAPMYQEMAKDFNVGGGAIVSGSFQGFDQGYLLHALKQLGDKYVGVVNLPHDVSNEEIIRLSEQNIRAVRFNLFRGGSEKVEHLVNFAQRIYDLAGMHVELYISGAQINAYYGQLLKLPKVSIDHLGLTREGQTTLLKLVERGVRVKATGFMRVDFDVLTALKAIHGVNSDALMFATDFPGTRASRLCDQNDVQLIKDNFDERSQLKIFQRNACQFYNITL